MTGKQLVPGCYAVTQVGVELTTFKLQGRTRSTVQRRPAYWTKWVTWLTLTLSGGIIYLFIYLFIFLTNKMILTTYWPSESSCNCGFS